MYIDEGTNKLFQIKSKKIKISIKILRRKFLTSAKKYAEDMQTEH
jgi:hypothetical protein